MKVANSVSAQNGAWRCTVCGYIHRGPNPPEVCPVCGAPQTDFERYEEQPATAEISKVEQWRCLICNYVHPGPNVPEVCPICAARTDEFEPLGQAAERAATTAHAPRVLILGAGIAGLSAAESIRGASPEAAITLVSEENELPYYRLNLTRYLAGEIAAESLPIHPLTWYRGQRIRLLQGVRAEALSLEQRCVELSDGALELFEKLIITVGAHPFLPPIAGGEKEGVVTLRTRTDADALLAMARTHGRCVCVGGGILGLEAAGALAKHGVRVTLLEGHGWLLPRQLTLAAGKLLERRVAGLGIDVRTGVQVKEIVGDKHAQEVRLTEGSALSTQVIAVTAGVRPNTYLAREAGLDVHNGIVVDNRLVASHPDVFAAGDVAEHRNTLYGTWAPSQYQGSIAGTNAAGLAAEFGGIPRSNMLKVLGIDLFSIGNVSAEDASYEVLSEQHDDLYYRFVFRDNRLHGAILLGDTALAAAVKHAMETQSDFSSLLRKRPNVPDLLAYLTERQA